MQPYSELYTEACECYGRSLADEYELAAYSVWRNLMDRRGIKWVLADLNMDVRLEILEMIANTFRIQNLHHFDELK